MVVNGVKRKLSFKIIIAAIILLSSAPSAWAQETKQTLAAAAILPSAQAIKSCMSRQDGAECLDNLIREALKTSQTYLKFWVHENEVGNSVTRAKHALSEIEGTQEPKTKIRSTKSKARNPKQIQMTKNTQCSKQP